MATLHGNDQLITAHLTSLLAMWDPEPAWWFTRPDPPGRVRLWIAASLPDAAARAASWARRTSDLRILADLRWETDHPDAARSGPAPLAAAAEHAAAADSRAAIAALAWASSGGPGQHVITAASLVDIAIAFTGSTSAGLHWIITSLAGHGEAARPARAARDQAVRIACPAGDFAALRAQPGSNDTAAAWTSRRTAITRYAAASRDAGHCPGTMLTALLRGHATRLNGPGDQDWQAAARLARAAALAATARSPARP